MIFLFVRLFLPPGVRGITIVNERGNNVYGNNSQPSDLQEQAVKRGNAILKENNFNFHKAKQNRDGHRIRRRLGFYCTIYRTVNRELHNHSLLIFIFSDFYNMGRSRD